jgi:hypothetical protein
MVEPSSPEIGDLHSDGQPSRDSRLGNENFRCEGSRKVFQE